MNASRLPRRFPLLLTAALLVPCPAVPQTHKPILHGRHWIVITGKPLAATAGARMFERGGNAVDAACAMLAAACTMFDDLSWGGETQALVHHPGTGKVTGINACGVAPTGATADFFKSQGFQYPPGEGPLAAITPGTPGGLMTLLAEFGTLSLREVLEPAMQMAEGYPAEAQFVRKVENGRNLLRHWPYSRQLFLSHDGRGGAPVTGQLFRQPDLLETLRKLVEAETRALESGMDRKAAILAAQDRFYQGDVAAEFVRGSREQGGLHTLEDLAAWRVKLEEPVKTTYKGIEVYKLTTWTQGPVLLQMLNLLEPLDLQAMGYNSARYIHTLYQVMNLAFADRDFYYGDPSFPPDEPIRGLLSRDYAGQRRGQINRERNDRRVKPGDPYPFQDSTNPHLELLEQWGRNRRGNRVEAARDAEARARADAAFLAGTTSIQAADAEGWAVSITPSGGWLPVCIAGRTGIGMSQRMQSFVLDERENPFNVVAPGKRPRVTLTPTLALKEGRPFLCFSVQGGDTQDQNLLQFFLNMVEFGMTVQEASEAANITNHQMYSSFGDHESEPGLLTLTDEVPSWVRRELGRMGYRLEFKPRNSGPITAIYFDQEHGTLQGGVSNDGEDHGIAW